MSRCTGTRLRLAALLALLSSCAPARGWPPTAVALRPGEDSCAECRMIVSDPRFAAQRHSPDGPVEWFDDLGCLVEKYGPDGSDPMGVFVHAFDGEDWVRADRGHAVCSADIGSPMGYGWCAFPTAERARVAAARHLGAEVLPITDLLRGGAGTPPARQPVPDPETPRRN